MKKFIIVLIFAFILSFGATQAKAVSLDDLLAEIMSLKTQVTELKTQLTAAVRTADALRTTAGSAPLWMTPYIVTGSGPFPGKYVYTCNDGVGNSWSLDMGDNDRLGSHYSNNGITCDLVLALANNLSSTVKPITDLGGTTVAPKATTSSVVETKTTSVVSSTTPISQKVSGGTGTAGTWTPVPGSAYECDKFFKACFEWSSGHIGSGSANLVPPSHNYLCPNCAFIASRIPVAVGFLGDSSSLITYGEKSDRVKEFQKFLINQGYLAPGSDTGLYGNATMVATKTFQNAYGVSGNGTVVGPKTQIVLKKMAQ